MDGSVVVKGAIKDRAGNTSYITSPLEIRNNLERFWLTKANGFLVEMKDIIGANIEANDLEVQRVIFSPFSEDNTGASPIVSVRYAQVGPGGYPVEEAYVNVALTTAGQAVGVESGFVDNLPEHAPSVAISQAEANNIASQAVGLDEMPTTISSDLAWVFVPTIEEIKRYVLAWRVVMYFDGHPPIYMVVNSVSGKIERSTVRSTFNHLSIAGSVNSVKQDGILRPYDFIAIDGYHYDDIFGLTNKWLMPFSAIDGLRSNLPNQYYSPSTLSFKKLNVLQVTKQMNDRSFLGNSFAQYFPRSASTRANVHHDACWRFGDSACAYPLTIGGNSLSHLDTVHYFYPSSSLSDSRLIAHEVTHGLLYSNGLFPAGSYWAPIGVPIDAIRDAQLYGSGASPISWFHEGVAQAMECIFFDQCLRRETDGPYLADQDNWNATDESGNADVHDRGSLLQSALAALNERLKVYGDPNKRFKGFELVWAMAKTVALKPGEITEMQAGSATVKDPQQLGRTANTLSSMVRTGYGGIDDREFQEAFVSEIAYWYQYFGLPLGLQAFKAPPNADMIGFSVEFGAGTTNLPFTERLRTPNVLGREIAKNEPINLYTVGTLRTGYLHQVRFYRGNPLMYPNEPSCAILESKAPNSLNDKTWLGEVRYNATEVKNAVHQCVADDEADGWLDNCALPIYVDAMLVKTDGSIYQRASRLGLFHGQSHYANFRVSSDGNAPECGEYIIAAGIAESIKAIRYIRDGLGCKLARTPADIVVVLFPFAIFLWRRFRRH